MRAHRTNYSPVHLNQWRAEIPKKNGETHSPARKQRAALSQAFFERKDLVALLFKAFVQRNVSQGCDWDLRGPPPSRHHDCDYCTTAKAATRIGAPLEIIKLSTKRMKICFQT